MVILVGFGSVLVTGFWLGEVLLLFLKSFELETGLLLDRVSKCLRFFSAPAVCSVPPLHPASQAGSCRFRPLGNTDPHPYLEPFCPSFLFQSGSVDTSSHSVPHSLCSLVWLVHTERLGSCAPVTCCRADHARVVGNLYTPAFFSTIPTPNPWVSLWGP